MTLSREIKCHHVDSAKGGNYSMSSTCYNVVTGLSGLSINRQQLMRDSGTSGFTESQVTLGLNQPSEIQIQYR